MGGVNSYATDASSNTTLGGITLADSMAPTNLDNSFRAAMADIRKGLNDIGGKAVSSGTDTVTLTTDSTVTSYFDGLRLTFIAGGSNTGAATLNVDSVGAKKILKGGGTALGAGDIASGMPVDVVYDESADSASGAWMLLNPNVASAYTSGGTDVALADGGTGASLSDPGGDRALFWDDSESKVDWLAISTGLSISTTNLAIDKATDANVRAAASNKVLTSDLIESASALVSLTDDTTVAADWDAGVNFSLTITANRTLGNPTNGQPGTWRTIHVQGNSTTDRTLTFGNQYLNDLPTLTDIDSGQEYILIIYCLTTSHFIVSAIKATDF